MTDRPILFSAPMVSAILREIAQPGTGKTQTRRVIEPERSGKIQSGDILVSWPADALVRQGARFRPKYSRGDRLWVREAWRCNGWATDLATIFYRASERYGYTAMCEQYPVADKKPLRVTGTWRPSIHMPRWASRITLEVTGVRVERLQDISEADAIAEGITTENVIVDMKCYGGAPVEVTADRSFYDGCPEEGFADPVDAFGHLWCGINSDLSWQSNPWVIAITFRPILANIDSLGAMAA